MFIRACPVYTGIFSVSLQHQVRNADEEGIDSILEIKNLSIPIFHHHKMRTYGIRERFYIQHMVCIFARFLSFRTALTVDDQKSFFLRFCKYKIYKHLTKWDEESTGHLWLYT
ncbi:MAG TPA: hypothetical protein DDW42_05705 [Desulfobacteraceae bacterium]|nr:hypothetical protein [Desulfobacteraceae bacterium]